MFRKLPRTVIVLGFVSLFNDFSSEMVVPLIPVLLATVLAAGPVALGLVEGAADAVAAFLKLWSGRHSDVLGGRRKPLTLSGYLLSNVTRPLLAVAGSWPVVLLLRSIDRVGKGFRSAPRDALVADSTPGDMRGYAFGFHRALDNGGAVLGSLAAAAVLAWVSGSIHDVMWLSAIPGATAVALIAFGVKDTRTGPPAPERGLLPLRWGSLSGAMRRYLVVLGLFTFARASETFIVLLGHEIGMGVVELLLLWAVLNLAKAIAATPGGRLADRIGTSRLILLGWAAFGVTFMLLGQADRSRALWVATILYGLAAGMGEGPERALIGSLAQSNEKGTAFGWYHLMLGVAAVPAGVLFGGVWHFIGARAAFSYAGALALLSALLLQVWVRPKR
ncbi:MAG: MFS transporter [Betaproteobacteria bacterium]|nr:MFS transporter [Betaproteobacteria bacterium]